MAEEYDVALTTIDNPFDPLDDWDEWLRYDMLLGYNTCAYLARIVGRIPESFTQKEEDAEIERAIDEIVTIDPFNVYRKVKRKSQS